MAADSSVPVMWYFHRVMLRRDVLWLLVLRVLIQVAVAACDKMPQEDDACLACLCRVMTNCATNRPCEPPANPACGLLRITEPYWIDAGRPVQPGDHHALPGAFKRCVEEPFCAVQTVQNYMTFQPSLKDCDENGFTCKDLLRAHLFGKYECNTKDDDSRFAALESCLEATRERMEPNP